jgi:hypothetical protein
VRLLSTVCCPLWWHPGELSKLIRIEPKVHRWRGPSCARRSPPLWAAAPSALVRDARAAARRWGVWALFRVGRRHCVCAVKNRSSPPSRQQCQHQHHRYQ